MTPERWEHIKQVFYGALARPPAERASFIDSACEGDEAARREVSELISAHEETDEFLNVPAFEVAARSLSESKAELLTQGQVISRYRVVRALGAGGMGEVYLAEDTGLGRPVALKLLPGYMGQDAGHLSRFEREARAASALNHPNILTIHEVGHADGLRFIATEYVDGVTLRERLTEGRIPLGEIFDVAAHLASALSAAHEAGIVHRDIKPENVMLRRDRLVKVLDFGIAKLTEDSALRRPVATQSAARAPVKTSTGLVMGTAHYMSPEQARGLEVDARTDIWSLGVVLYEMVAGRPPFEGETSSHVIVSILESRPPALDDVPAELWRIIGKALRKERDERYQVVKDMLLDLKSLREEMEFEAKLDRSERLVASAGARAQKYDARPPAASTDEAVARTSVGHRAATALSSGPLAAAAVVGRLRGAVLITAAFLVLTAGLVYLFSLVSQNKPGEQPPPPPPPQRALSRLTFDAGLQSEPAWSPDGRFIAYSSDRGGNFDIWVQPVGGGDPVQVTRSPAHDWQPDWSPDGNQVVFRSEREGGGLFVAPALGGRERRVSSFGYRPRWSPDATKILFANTLLSDEDVGMVPVLHVVGLNGDPPSQILHDFLAEFRAVIAVAWHPDGRRVSVLGSRDITRDALKECAGFLQPMTFWTVPIEGGKPLKSEVAAGVEEQLAQSAVSLAKFRWAPSGAALYFEGVANEVRNLWKVTVDPQTLSWVAGPERLTTGLGTETDITISPDGKRLAFSTRTQSTRVWSLPFDARAGKVKGEGRPVTAAGIHPVNPDLSRDGKKLVFVARRPGTQKEELWEKSLEDGRETLLAADDHVRAEPTWSPDGKLLMYTRMLYTNPERTAGRGTYCFMPAGGGEERAFENRFELVENPQDMTADGRWVLGLCYRPPWQRERTRLCVFPSAPHDIGEVRTLFSDPVTNVFQPRFSPDEKWISFLGQKMTEPGVSVIYVTPSSGGEMTPITEGEYWYDKPRWAPDGKTIYFISNRDMAFFNVWGIRFDSARGKPAGAPFKVTSFDNPGRIISPVVNRMQMAVSETRLVVPLMEVTGSIWMLEGVDR
ncbi:MAG TPA: protein kinase [Pyrinomonadaceae bacterium]|nr:protein kinase [Pyrinomonadaceae bacterium]